MTESSTDMSFQYPYRINNIRKGGATSIDKKYRTFQYPYGINILERSELRTFVVPFPFQYPFQYPYGIQVLERARPANPCSYGVNFQGSANLPFWGV